MLPQDIEQGTEAWMNCRLGKVTASKIADVMARTKTGYSASRANYAAQLVTERLTGRREEGFTNAAMQWGTDTEPQARAMYELETGSTVVECGFFDHRTIHMTGASPDGLVGDKGLVEIKCPNSATHIATLRGEPIPDKYIKQMQWQMACTGRDWCDFASFDPRLPDAMQLHVQRVTRDDALIAEMEAAVFEFLREVDSTVADLTTRYLKEAA
jgi:putative phage-type endonuclease